jgi:undecaprenyl-diphosphatase
MQFWQAIILGIVQGLTEFIPVSSSAHLLMVQNLMGLSGDYLLFDLMLHVGTLGAVFAYFFKDIIALFKPPFKRMGLLVLATIPAAVAGVFLSDVFDDAFGSGRYICFFFLITAALMFLTDYLAKRNREKALLEPFGIKQAAAMGLMQALGVLPGVSRSGSTIFGGVAARGDSGEVATFSMLMSIPIILGSAAVETLKVFRSGAYVVDVWCVLGGIITSFVCGYFAIMLVMKLIRKANFKWFGVYLIAMSVATFLWLFL